MTIETRLVLIVGAWIILGFTTIVLAVEVSPLFPFAALALLIMLGKLVRRTKCPSCSMPVLLRHVHVAGFRLLFFVTTIPRECPNCGTQLRSDH
jgi:ribosomal protein S27AE